MAKARETKSSLFGGRAGKADSLDHVLIGHNVLYLGKVWKVLSAHRANKDVEPWLTLRRGHAEVAAKPHEVSLAFD